ncbi:Dual specificity phosphatase [Trypanosoma melophagium]|uniref:Dual specificity phosphatase n=1 Tax=Trypanosoma melophagium TaxID=715481 RepID=UPI00351AA2AE|nr:Dual specificity phosphatase [Trypanosoma melophagium]
MAALERKTLANKDKHSANSGRAPLSSELQRVFAVLRFISQQQEEKEKEQNEKQKEDVLRRDTKESHGRDSKMRREANSTISGHNSTGRNRDTIALPSAKPLIIPDEIALPLEEFRMAVTNLPVQKEAVCSTRNALYNALLHFYPNKSHEVDALCNKDSSLGDPNSGSVPTFMLTGVYTMQGMQEIVPGLFVGSYHPATNKEMLTRHRITHILCCIGTQPRFPNDFVYMTISAKDNTTYKISEFFPKTSAFIENVLIKQHSAVLVHCGAGISRAPTIAAAYLMKKLRLTAGASISLIQQRRQVASPNIGFRQQLRAYQEELGI